ncbi:hypothetical protein [Paenibacillus sp. FSL L8-0323]|uniref:hypothetical protein n=1 Tax=unclassified Paenibacillus TaxID=185978 RepID=UPI0030F9799D
MEILVRRYDSCVELKEEVATFIEILTSQKPLPNINELNAITKYIIFIKRIVEFGVESHYKRCALFDALSCLNSLTGRSIRQFHYIYRSFIENYLRSMLLLEDDDETGVNQLFRNFEEKLVNSVRGTELYYHIKDEYSKSCLYVHSNQKANIETSLQYLEIIKNDDFNTRTLRGTINKILLMLKTMCELLIICHPENVENAFYRSKQKLRFLLGESLYNKFTLSIGL